MTEESEAAASRRLHPLNFAVPGRNEMRAFYDRIVALVFAVGLAVGAAAVRPCGPYEDALAGFTTDDFSDTADAIEAVAACGDPRARRFSRR